MKLILVAVLVYANAVKWPSACEMQHTVAEREKAHLEVCITPIRMCCEEREGERKVGIYLVKKNIIDVN